MNHHPVPFGPPDRPTARPSGSTLLELIVVLALLAILLGVAVPALTAVPQATEGRGGDERTRLAAVRSGLVTTGDSVVALPDGRTLRRGGHNAR